MGSELEALLEDVREAQRSLAAIAARVEALLVADRAKDMNAFDAWKERAFGLFVQWCSRGLPTEQLEDVDWQVVSAVAEPSASFARDQPRLKLRPHFPGGPFVRLSPRGADRGMVLPNPDVHYEPAHAHLFPHLPPDWRDHPDLGAVVSPRITVLTGGEWEVE